MAAKPWIRLINKIYILKRMYVILGWIRFMRSRKHVILKMGHRFQCEAMQRGINFDS